MAEHFSPPSSSRASRTSREAAETLRSTPYSFVRHIGGGAMGEIVEAEHIALRRRVVVKLLRAEYAEDPAMLDRLRLEAQAAASLGNHPNIVQVLDFGQTQGGSPYIVFELLSGLTLREEIQRRGPVPAAEAVGLVLQLLAGLAEAHANGIIHRDIKPGNLFLCDPDKNGKRALKILDFGIAKVASMANSRRAPMPLALPTREGMIVGTPRFLSPEQALGGVVDSRADLYATGVVLYWLLTGRDPFQHHKNVLAIIQAHVAEPPVPPSVVAPYPIPPALDRAVLRALEKRPRDRFSSAEELADELQRAVQPTAAAPRWSRTEPLDTRPLQRARQEIDRPTVKLAVLPLPAAEEREAIAQPCSAPSGELRARALVALAMLFLALAGTLILLLRTRA